jgi:hypothetical protein
MLPIPLQAWEVGELPGEDAPEYEILLDMGYWLENYNLEKLVEMFGWDLDSDVERVLKTIEKACGCNNWRQKELWATDYEGSIHVKSVVECRTHYGDDSFSALLVGWEPGVPDLINNFSRDDLIALYAVGNPTGFLDVMMEWFVETGWMRRIIESMPLDEEEAIFKLVLRNIQMLAKGYWYTAKEDLYPLLGDEKVLALYTNDDFVGWENLWSAETPEEFMMAHIIVAVELREPGFTERFTEYAQDYADVLGLAFSFGRPSDKERFRIQVMEADGYEIYYMDVEDLFHIGWAEYGGAFFISNPDTLSNLPHYFVPSSPIRTPFDGYNEYFYMNADLASEIFFQPFDAFIGEELVWMEGTGEDEYIKALQDIRALLGSGELGEIGVYDVIHGYEVTITMGADRVLADLMLKVVDVLEYTFEEGVSMVDAIEEYLDFYGG